MGGAGRSGAIWAARRRRQGHPQPTAVSEKRLADMKKMMEESAAITKVMQKYDTNKTGKLERDQVKNLLTDIDTTTAKGTAPTEDELNFILKYADQQNKNAVGDGAISRNEVRAAILQWNHYCKRRTEMEDLVKKYDTSKTGKLELPELKELLQELNSACEVTDEEVSWVMQQADLIKDGAITAPELMVAIAQWYTLVEEQEKKNACCIVL
eukprot:NODE_13441_length_1165_cov_8.936416.p1 GENE.NODE_13441_length_1165_cov_8.936416~~NODE_13441_length_1165_cov_8.936416.p1  ORF type:complete len:245 (+),score=55.79 NODE_13441_length_1165_cov_8.936416:103-735(+)